jgi:hypothetical protein
MVTHLRLWNISGNEMNPIRNHFVGLGLCLALLLPSQGVATTTEDGRRAITHLLKYVAESNCVFIRNDKEYDSKDAAQHMRAKYDFFLGKIQTPEEFIESTASKSMVTGEPYWVKCADRSPVLSAEWLTKELSNYRQTLPDRPLTK